MKTTMSLSLTRLKRYIRYTEVFRDFDEVYAIAMADESKMLLQCFFHRAYEILNKFDKVGEAIDEIKQQHNEVMDNMKRKDVKLMDMKIEYEFERLITQLKICRDASMSELLNGVDNMIPDEVKSFCNTW